MLKNDFILSELIRIYSQNKIIIQRFGTLY